LELLVDGQSRQPAASATFGEALAALRREMSQAGRAIVTILLDGQELEPQQEEALLAQAPAALGRVEIKTAPAGEWGRHVLGEVAGALGQLGDDLRACAEILRAGDLTQGLDRYNAILAAYTDVIRALVNAETLAKVPSPLGSREALAAVTAAAQQMGKALGAADGVAAADLAEYELPERLTALAVMVRSMAASE
jgi:hypothetical protein